MKRCYLCGEHHDRKTSLCNAARRTSGEPSTAQTWTNEALERSIRAEGRRLRVLDDKA